MKGHQRFGFKGKLAPRYTRPFEVVERLGTVALRLRLPPQLAGVLDVFHVSMLQRCKGTTQGIVDWDQLDIQPDITYEEQPVQILDRKIQ